jgi:serine protease Do
MSGIETRISSAGRTGSALAVRLMRGAALTLALGAATVPAVVLPFTAAQARGSMESLAPLVEQVMDAVVNIKASQTVDRTNAPAPENPGGPLDDLFNDFFNQRRGEGNREQGPQRRGNSLGSGFVIDAAGYIVTNNHVIEGANDIVVVFNDRTELKAEIVGRDPKVDLAVLKVTPTKPLKAVPFGDSSAARVGDFVLAIGNPFGFGGSVSVGIVSAKNRQLNSGPYDSYLQTDAAINRGNSGGPLFNMNGEVIGINTAIVSPSGGSIGIGFSVPSALAQPIIAQLREFGETRRGWLGVRIQNVDEAIAESLNMKEAKGAMVAGVEAKGPAAPAGIQSGDVIIRFDGKEIASSSDLPRIVAETPVGKTVDIVIIRRGEEMVKQVTLGRLEEGERLMQASSGDAPADAAAPITIIGLDIAALTPELRAQFRIREEVKGVVVTKVAPNSNAAERRIAAGDVIVEVAQEAVSTPGDVKAKIDKLKSENKKVALLAIANATGDLRYVAVSIE